MHSSDGDICMGDVYSQTDESVPARPQGSLCCQKEICRHSQQSHVSTGMLPVQCEIKSIESDCPACSEKRHLSDERSTRL